MCIRVHRRGKLHKKQAGALSHNICLKFLLDIPPVRWYNIITKYNKGYKKMKNYKVNSEYWDMWGVNSEDESIIDRTELERLAAEWEKTIDELLEQVEEID